MKLRSYISLVLSTLILFANMGLVVNMHYCHDKVTSVSMAYNAPEQGNDDHHKHDVSEKSCCKKAVTKHKKCCKDDIVKLKDSNEKTLVKSFQLDLSAFCSFSVKSIQRLFVLKSVPCKKELVAFYCESNAPPLYKLYSQYIFYA